MWLTVVESEGHALIEDDYLSSEEQGDEFLLMGLRLAEGIEPAVFQAMSGRGLDPRRVASLVADGMVEYTPRGRIRVSAEGFPVLDAVVPISLRKQGCVGKLAQSRSSIVSHRIARAAHPHARYLYACHRANRSGRKIFVGRERVCHVAEKRRGTGRW